MRNLKKLQGSAAGYARGQVDLTAAASHAASMLEALGIDLDNASMRSSPRRMVKALDEMFSPQPFEWTSFENDEHYSELIVVREVPFRSFCEHHLLPFFGVANVGYLPADRLLGLSKIARLVQMLAARPQVQERLTQLIAATLQEELAPVGVGVVVRAEHTCMTLRGAQATGSTTTTSAVLGRIRDDLAARQEFLAACVA